MKKLLLFHHYNTCVGAGLCLFQIAMSLKNNYDVTVCLPNIPGDLDSILHKNGIRTIKQNNFPSTYSHYNGCCKSIFSRLHIKEVINIIKNKSKLEKVLQTEKPDIVMVNSMTLFWMGKLFKKFNVKSICYIRESYCKTLLNIRTNYIKCFINKYFDEIIFISKYDMNETGKLKNKYTLITDKVDFSLYDYLQKDELKTELLLPKDKNIILYVGGDNPIKGPLVILNALKQLNDNHVLVYLQHSKPNDKFKNKIRRLFGKDMSYRVEEYIKKHDLSGRVILRPATTEVEKYFTAADIVVFPNIVAHQARPIYEAGYVKNPIIATDFVNIKEFLNDKTGFVFAKSNYKQLAMIINNIFEGKENIREKLENNYTQTVKNHDFKTLTSEINTVIERI